MEAQNDGKSGVKKIKKREKRVISPLECGFSQKQRFCPATGCKNF